MDSPEDNFFGWGDLGFFGYRCGTNPRITLQIPMFPQHGLYRGGQIRRFFAFSRTSKNVVKQIKYAPPAPLLVKTLGTSSKT